MGRRQQVIEESAQKLQSEGLEAIGVQVTSASKSVCKIYRTFDAQTTMQADKIINEIEHKPRRKVDMPSVYQTLQCSKLCIITVNN